MRVKGVDYADLDYMPVISNIENYRDVRYKFKDTISFLGFGFLKGNYNFIRDEDISIERLYVPEGVVRNVNEVMDLCISHALDNYNNKRLIYILSCVLNNIWRYGPNVGKGFSSLTKDLFELKDSLPSVRDLKKKVEGTPLEFILRNLPGTAFNHVLKDHYVMGRVIFILERVESTLNKTETSTKYES